MRTFNVRLFAILVASVAIFGVGIYLLHGFQVRRNAHVFLEVADEYHDKVSAARREENVEAVKKLQAEELRNLNEYCSKRPDDLDAAERLGNLLMDMGQAPKAMSIFEKVLRQAQARGEERPDVRRKLAELAIGMGMGTLQRGDLSARDRNDQSTPLFSAAQDHLQNYLLKENPDDGELWFLLGKCQVSLKQNADAAKTLAKAIALAPKQVEAYYWLAQILLQLKKVKEADQCMEKLVEVNPDSYRARLLAGEYLMNRGSLDAAIDNVTKAVALAKPAVAQAERAAKDDPDDFQLQRDYQTAVGSQRLALLDAARCLLATANRSAGEGKNEEATARFEEARKYARQAIKLFPSQPVPYETLADIELAAGRLDEIVRTGNVTREGQLRVLRTAEKVLRDGMQAADERGKQDLLWRAANMLLDAGETQEADKLADKLRAGEYQVPLLAYLEARIAMSQENWQKAIGDLDQARSGLAGTALQAKVIDYYLGQCYGRLGNPDQQKEAYRRALAADPNYAAAKEGLSIALLNSGDVDNAVAEYVDLRRLGHAPAGTALALARSMIARNMRVGPSQRKWTQVEDLLAEAKKAAPDSVQIPLVEAEMLVARGEAKRAETLLRGELDKRPKEVALWTKLAALAMDRNDLAGASKILDEADEKLGDCIPLRLARAQYVARRYPPAEAAPLLRKLADKADGFSAGEQLVLCNSLSHLSQNAGDLEQATRLARLVADKLPTNVQLRFRLFELAQAARDEAGAQKALDEVKKIEGEGPMWCYGEAVRLFAAIPADRTKDPRFDQALALLAAAGKSRSTWADVPRMTGHIYDRQGKSAEALRYFQQGIKLGDRREDSYARAVQLLAQQKRYPEAEALLQDLETQQGMLSDKLRQLQQQLQMQRGDVELALETARRAAESSDDYRAHLRLGRMLYAGFRQAAVKGESATAAKLVAEATQAFQQAVKLDDKTSETWLALVQFLCATGQADKAKEAVAEAVQKLPAKELQTSHALAQCYEALGDMPAAQEKYEALLDAAPDNPAAIRILAEFYFRTGRSQQAEAQLQRVLGGSVKAEPGDMQWARRLKAAILLGQGGYHNQEQARKLIEENLAQNPASTDDLRSKAKIMALLPDRARRDEAIAILERLARSAETRSNDDWYNLGLFYLGRGDWGKANDALLRLLAAAGDEPQYLVTYIIAAMQRKELQNAERWLDHLQQVAPNQFQSVGLRAELLVRRGKYEEALNLLKGFIDRPAALPADGGARRVLVAEKFEQLAPMIGAGADQQLWRLRYLRESESLWRQYAGERPGQEVVVIAFLVRQGNCGEALTLLERVWSKMNPVTLAQVITPLLAPGRPDKEQLQRGEKLLGEAIQRFDRPVPLLLAQADIWTLHERYDEAEKLYREVLAKNGNNPVVLNNLAMLLALQGVKLDEALKLIDRAIEVSGPVAQMLDTRASVYIALKQPDKALADIQNTLADAERPERLFRLAQAYRLKDDKTAAAGAIRKANEKGLKADDLQPLERAGYKELLKLLK